MPKKGKPGRSQRPLSKRQHSHWQMLKRRQMIILAGGILAIVAVVAVLGVGWYTSSYRPMHEVVLRVNNTQFDMQYFISALQVQTQGQNKQYAETIAQNLPRSIEQNELVRQGAAQLGVTVSDDEIDKGLKDAKLPNDAAHRDIERTQLLMTRLKSDYFEKQVPTEAAQVNMQAMLLESENQSIEVRARVQKGESFSDIAKTVSVDNYTKSKSGDIGWHPQDVIKQLLGTAVPGDYAFGSPAGTLSQPRYDADVSKSAGYWLVKINGTSVTDQPDISIILLGSQEEVLTVRARVVAGEAFASVAKEVSQLPNVQDNGGNIGGVSPNSLPQALNDYVFNANTKAWDLSDPIRDTTASSKGGYWLVNVLEKADSRKIDDADRDLLKSQALNQWAGSLWLDPSYKIEDFMDQAKLTYAVAHI